MVATSVVMMAKAKIVATEAATDWAKVMAQAEAFTANLASKKLVVSVNSVAEDLSAMADLVLVDQAFELVARELARADQVSVYFIEDFKQGSMTINLLANQMVVLVILLRVTAWIPSALEVPS